MSNNKGGFDYENKVIGALLRAGCAGSILEGAGSSSADADADFVIDGVRYLVEVKKNAVAQMGGTSVRFANGNFSFAKGGVEENTQQRIISLLQSKAPLIQDLLAKINCEAFPARCTKETWQTAKEEGYLIPVNTELEFDTDFIADHYTAKGINYIQIGGAGLFYLRDNPANLPIPELTGKINIELRPGRSGANKGMVSAGIRAQGRLQFRPISPFTLDDDRSIKSMLKTKKEENKNG